MPENKVSTPEEFEALAAQLHEVYEIELCRQGRVSMYPANYNDLSEQIKDLDRALARFILARARELVREAKRDGQLTEARIALATIVASGAIPIEDRRSQTLTAFRERIADLEEWTGAARALPIDPEEAVCQLCAGTGKRPFEWAKCPDCQGTGKAKQ